MNRDEIKQYAKQLAGTARILKPESAPALGQVLDLVARCHGLEDWNTLSRQVNNGETFEVDRQRVTGRFAEVAGIPQKHLSLALTQMGYTALRLPDSGLVLVMGEEWGANTREAVRLMCEHRERTWVAVMDPSKSTAVEGIRATLAKAERRTIYVYHFEEAVPAMLTVLLEAAASGHLVVATTEEYAGDGAAVDRLVLGLQGSLERAKRKQLAAQAFCGVVHRGRVILALQDHFSHPDFGEVPRARLQADAPVSCIPMPGGPG